MLGSIGNTSMAVEEAGRADPEEQEFLVLRVPLLALLAEVGGQPAGGWREENMVRQALLLAKLTPGNWHLSATMGYVLCFGPLPKMLPIDVTHGGAHDGDQGRPVAKFRADNVMAYQISQLRLLCSSWQPGAPNAKRLRHLHCHGPLIALPSSMLLLQVAPCHGLLSGLRQKVLCLSFLDQDPQSMLQAKC
eukprot:1159817-Pelagomonas_calceolata.AAC.11